MAAGIQYTKDEFDERVGGLARDLNVVLSRIGEIRAYLDTMTGGEIEALYGYESGDGAVIKSAYGDLDELRSVYEGGALSSQRDFRQFAKRIYGLGF